MDLLFLQEILLPKLSSVDLQDAVFIVIVFCTTSVVIKQLASESMECGDGPMLIEFTMFPIFLEQLV